LEEKIVPTRAQFDALTRVELGNLVIDFAAHRARWKNKPIELGPNEFRLLSHFASHPDRVHTRESLIAQLGKDCQAIDERTVDVWVGRLRRALRNQGVPDQLRTVWSVGYVYDSE
jgi:two-component system, OmpR family, phosphate regulon response regulator PhoB